MISHNNHPLQELIDVLKERDKNATSDLQSRFGSTLPIEVKTDLANDRAIDALVAVIQLAKYIMEKEKECKLDPALDDNGEMLGCGLMPLIDDYAKAVHDGNDNLCVVLRQTILATVEEYEKPKENLGQLVSEANYYAERLELRDDYHKPDPVSSNAAKVIRKLINTRGNQ